MTDLIRAHEGNVDTNSEFPTKVHWGKYNMMGRFITTTRHCQAQCVNSTEYEFPERRAITELFFKRPVMTLEVGIILSITSFTIGLISFSFCVIFQFRYKSQG